MIKKKKKLGSFPSTSVVFSITLALFVIGLFGLLILQSNNLKNEIKEQITVQIYLDKFVTESDKIRIQKILSQQPYVAKEDTKASIVFISKEEAAKLFIDKTGEDFIKFLGENPLRDAYNIKISNAYLQLDSLNAIKNDLSKINGVFEVEYVQNLVQAINENITKVSMVLMGFALILLITVVILINNTIKLALFSQRFLIRSMQLVGAKTGFIMLPFLKRAGIQGFFSGVLACSLLYTLLRYATSIVQEMQALQSDRELLLLAGIIIFLGFIIAMVSTYRAVNKYLKMSLDELY